MNEKAVDAALKAWFASPPSETDQGLERSMRAALEAALPLLGVERAALPPLRAREEIAGELCRQDGFNWNDCGPIARTAYLRKADAVLVLAALPPPAI
jgi:hypothetical protein